MSSPQAAVRYFEKLYEDMPTNENKYAYHNALQANGQTDRALHQMDELLKKFPRI